VIDVRLLGVAFSRVASCKVSRFHIVSSKSSSEDKQDLNSPCES
jgi:hypothetical protein